MEAELEPVGSCSRLPCPGRPGGSALSSPKNAPRAKSCPSQGEKKSFIREIPFQFYCADVFFSEILVGEAFLHLFFGVEFGVKPKDSPREAAGRGCRTLRVIPTSLSFSGDGDGHRTAGRAHQVPWPRPSSAAATALCHLAPAWAPPGDCCPCRVSSCP